MTIEPEQQRLIDQGARLRKVRKAKHLTQKEFGEKLGNIDEATISKYESGKLEISKNAKLELISSYNLRMQWLEDGKDPMYAANSFINNNERGWEANEDPGKYNKTTAPDDFITLSDAILSADAFYTIWDNSLEPAFPRGTKFSLALKKDGVIKPGKLYALRTSDDFYLGQIYYDKKGGEYLVQPTSQVLHTHGDLIGKYIFPAFSIPDKKVIDTYDIILATHHVKGETVMK